MTFDHSYFRYAGQAIGGLVWALFAGQPLVVIATTASVSLYSKVVYEMSIVLDEGRK